MMTDRVKYVNDDYGDAMGTLSVVRGLDGVYAKGVKMQKAKGLISGDELKATLNKYGGWVRVLSLSLFAITIARPLAEMALRVTDLEAVVNVAFSGPVGPVPTVELPKWLDNAAGWIDKQKWLSFLYGKGPAVASDLTRRAQAKAPQMDAYLRALKSIAKAVKKGDTGAFEALRESLVAADAAFFGPLEVLYRRCQCGSGFPGAEGEATWAFRDTRDAASLAAGLLYLSLECWAISPATKETEILGNLKELQKVAKRAYKAATEVEIAIGGGPVPGLLTLAVAEPSSTELVSGGEVILEVTVENIGDTATSAGTITLVSGQDTEAETDRLTLIDPAERSLPDLAAGGKVTVTWRVILPVVASTEIVGYEVRAVAGEGEGTQASGNLFVTD
jgi:hypothetical protein